MDQSKKTKILLNTMEFDKTSNLKLDFNDLLIQPAVKTEISSRSQVNPYDSYGMLPIITAPMDTVVDSKNKSLFLENKINVCLPRNVKAPLFDNKCFESMSLDEFIDQFLIKTWFISPDITTRDTDQVTCTKKRYVLIDIANGHMTKMMNTIKAAKEKYGEHLYIMAGNVANPGTFKELAMSGADAIRIGIGNGNGCLTTQQTGIGYPMASLIRECYYQTFMLDKPVLIIADGGMKDYSDIIKALALGADYVMVGSLLNKSLESCGETRIWKYIKVNPNSKLAVWLHKKGFKLTKRFRGMSTKEVQKNWGSESLKTSEGVVRIRPVEYTLNQWAGNLEDYLRSAMSYTNCKTLQDFRGNVKINAISENAFRRFNK